MAETWFCGERKGKVAWCIVLRFLFFWMDADEDEMDEGDDRSIGG